MGQQHEQNSPMDGRTLQNKHYHQKLQINPKEQDYDHRIIDLSKEVNN